MEENEATDSEPKENEEDETDNVNKPKQQINH